MENREVVIVDGVRTAFGRMGGSLRPYTAVELASMTIKGLLDKPKILERVCMFGSRTSL